MEHLLVEFIWPCALFSFGLLGFLLLAVLLIRIYVARLKRNQRSHADSSGSSKLVHVAFFHPYCHAGGGGERVLWCSVRALLKRYRFVRCHVYTGDAAEGEEILRRAKERFNISLSGDVDFVPLCRRRWVEAETWPHFTLLGQSLGSVFLGLEALFKFVPDVYIDSMGYAFTLPLFKWFGDCRIGCYVHYPTISTDMLQRVSTREEAFNNAGFIARSWVLSLLKVFYYHIFAALYGFAGRRANTVLVNSTWTRQHIDSLWKVPAKTSVVYPPCDTSGLSAEELRDVPGKNGVHRIVSVAQFRPEKNHDLQLEAFAQLLKKYGKKRSKRVELVLVGGCRNEGDRSRVEKLKAKASQLNISKLVRFEVNVPYATLRDLLSSATIGLHTMVNEHFGIGVVECMAAGAVALAHDSGGPQLDIVVDWRSERTGYRGSSAAEYADRMREILEMPSEQRNKLREHARLSAVRFDDDTFSRAFIHNTEILFSW